MQHTLYPSKKSFLPNFVIFLIKTHSAWLSFNTNKTHTVTTAHTPTHTHTYSYNHTVTFSGNLVNASQRSSSPKKHSKKQKWKLKVASHCQHGVCSIYSLPFPLAQLQRSVCLISRLVEIIEINWKFQKRKTFTLHVCVQATRAHCDLLHI